MHLLSAITIDFRRTYSLTFLLLFFLLPAWKTKAVANKAPDKRPNILFVISDDQSFPHASAYGAGWIRTPAFDRVARAGVLFTHAFTASPGCSPSRAALLTGMNCWQIEDAGTHASGFPKKYKVYPDILEEQGYFVGYTQKGWGPGNWKISGRLRNPAGDSFNSHQLNPPTTGIGKNDYAANFIDFLAKRPADKPFSFWYGASEPHRVFEKGSGLKAGKKLEDAVVPSFLPDTKEIRSDLLDYALEIEWFDQQLGKMLQLLEESGELENTIVVVTSDNGMAFPRAKANLYEYGHHVPLAISWGEKIGGNRIVHDLVSLIDIAPTFLDLIGIDAPTGEQTMEGKSLKNILMGNKKGWVDTTRTAVYASRERHSSSRWNNMGYPQRSIRSKDFLYIRNFKAERWPAGSPQKYEQDGQLGKMHGGYHDIDACPTLDEMIAHRDDPSIGKFFHWAVDKRPDEELFDSVNDPGCLINLAEDPKYKNQLLEHRNKLGGYLMQTGDPRVAGNGGIYEQYPRYSPIREFPSDTGQPSLEPRNKK